MKHPFAEKGRRFSSQSKLNKIILRAVPPEVDVYCYRRAIEVAIEVAMEVATEVAIEVAEK